MHGFATSDTPTESSPPIPSLRARLPLLGPPDPPATPNPLPPLPLTRRTARAPSSTALRAPRGERQSPASSTRGRPRGAPARARPPGHARARAPTRRSSHSLELPSEHVAEPPTPASPAATNSWCRHPPARYSRWSSRLRRYGEALAERDRRDGQRHRPPAGERLRRVEARWSPPQSTTTTTPAERAAPSAFHAWKTAASGRRGVRTRAGRDHDEVGASPATSRVARGPRRRSTPAACGGCRESGRRSAIAAPPGAEAERELTADDGRPFEEDDRVAGVDASAAAVSPAGPAPTTTRRALGGARDAMARSFLPVCG